MSCAGLLLGADAVELYPPGGTDAHGWRLPASARYWAGTGNLQLAPGLSDPRAADRGGHGPYEPAAAETGQLFLPPGVPLAEGSLAVIRGRAWVLSQVRLVTDPVSVTGGIACWAATATAVTPPGGGDGEGEP